MTLAALLNIPKSPEDWNWWSFNHRLEHDRLRQAIQSKTNGTVNLFQYQLDPIDFTDVTEWLARHQQAHDDFNEVLSLQGVDLEGADFSDSNQLQSWIYLQWQEHNTANVALGI